MESEQGRNRAGRVKRNRNRLFRRRRIDVCHVERSRDISRCYLSSRRSERSATFVHVKIISGGQTGVDRAALDVALKRRIDCGGWCPAGRLDEFGRIPNQYPLQELEVGDRKSTRLNSSHGYISYAVFCLKKKKSCTTMH